MRVMNLADQECWPKTVRNSAGESMLRRFIDSSAHNHAETGLNASFIIVLAIVSCTAVNARCLEFARMCETAAARDRNQYALVEMS